MSNLKNKKILVVNDHGPTYFKPFGHLGLRYTQDTLMLRTDLDDVALVVFTGGSDVSPHLYSKNAHPRTCSNSQRDVDEALIFDIAVSNNIPVAGICRGAQFLCVMAGGKLVQDVTGHESGHHTVEAIYPEGHTRKIAVSSSHHQMQYPYDLPDSEFEVLAWGTKPLSAHYAFDNETTISANEATEVLKVEADVVWYPGIKALGAQYHPEWMRADTDGFLYFQDLVSHYLVPLMEERYETDKPGEKTTSATS